MSSSQSPLSVCQLVPAPPGSTKCTLVLFSLEAFLAKVIAMQLKAQTTASLSLANTFQASRPDNIALNSQVELSLENEAVSFLIRAME
jgi:hypothetical protein